MISCTGRRQVADRVSIKIYIFFNDSATHHSFNANRKSTSQINSKKCSCCRAYQSLIQWINFDFILKPVSFHLKFVMLHNDSSFSQILLSNCCQMRSDIMVLDILYLILVQLCTSRDVVINHQKMELFFSLFLMDCTEEHSTGFNSHHGSRWQVSDRN